MNPQFPLYIPSRGRHDTRHTMRALDWMKVPYFVVVDNDQWLDYVNVFGKDKVLVVDDIFLRDYHTLDNAGEDKSKGPGPKRNFAWEHAITSGYDWHWVMDDNISKFYRLNRNVKAMMADGSGFRCMEDFCLRYDNVAMAGPAYLGFTMRKSKKPPFVPNTRIYSCNLIKNNIRHRWRGRYNEDTILSLDILKSGLATIQFNAFLQDKIHTQRVKGGNTEAFYAKEGTYPKSKMLVNTHPDVARMAQRWGRWHHYVDYRKFRGNPLGRRAPRHNDENKYKLTQRLA